mgnify:CR=1 FL=1
MNIFYLILFISSLSTLFAASYDTNFYDKKVLYENAELLQLSNYQKNSLKQKISQEDQVNVSHDTTNFYNPPTPLYQSQSQSNKISQNISLYLSFEDVSKSIELQSQIDSSPTKNSEKELDDYFFDF